MPVTKKRIFTDVPWKQLFVQAEDNHRLEGQPASGHGIDDGHSLMSGFIQRNHRTLTCMGQELHKIRPGHLLPEKIQFLQRGPDSIDGGPCRHQSGLERIRIGRFDTS